MTLTVAERQHWKERIGKRIDCAIEAVYCLKDPTLLERIENDARQQAYASLGIEELLNERDQITADLARLEKESELIAKRMVAKIRSCDLSEVDLGYYSGSGIPCQVLRAVNAATAQIEEKLLAQHQLGKRVLDFRREKEELLDTVWLATSGKQIKELWANVCDRLQQEPTPMQADALRITPDES